MQRKLVSSAIALSLAALMIGTVTPVANAALPPDKSWVKSVNPVVPANACGVESPIDPAVLVTTVDHYIMYFSEHPNRTNPKIFVATTVDGGVTWVCANGNTPVVSVGGSGAWDESRAVNPVVINDEGTFKMWYTGRSAGAVQAIGYATSSDGIAWTKYGTAPVLTKGSPPAWDSEIVRNPSVVKIGGTYHMWYEGTAMWPYFKIGHATSGDGINWTKDINPVLTPTAGTWDANEVYNPNVVVNGGVVLEMFYSGNANGAWLTGHASSPDGIVWTKDANAILSPDTTGWDSSDSLDYAAAVQDGTTWKLFYTGGGTQIGMATLTASPQLTFRQLSSNVNVGGTVDVYIDLTAVTNMYGYQFWVNYDSTKVSAVGSFEDGFFTSVDPAWKAWNATCAAGVCKFGVSHVSPQLAATGSGALAKIRFTGSAPGMVSLTFSNDILTNINASPFTHSTTTGWLQVNGSPNTATVSGIVSLQGRGTPIDAGTVTLYEGSGYFPPTTVSFNASTGAWTAVVPVLPGADGSPYIIVASHGLYLSNQLSGLTFLAGNSYPQATTTLWGGDANNDGIINVGDLSCIGNDFGTSNNSCTGGSTDINADLTVNILDLVLAGGNLDKTTPRPW